MTGALALLSERASAAAEFALTLPLMLILLFGGMEAGHFVWTQHKLTGAVRDGARFAARIPVRNVCEGTETIISDHLRNEVNLLTRTGQLANAGAMPKIANWTAEKVSIDPKCDNSEFVDTGLYAEYAAAYPGAKGPVIVVSASNVDYPWMFGLLGSIMSGITGNGTDPLDLKLSAVSVSPAIGL